MTRILVGYLTEMETSGIDRYLLRMLENLRGESLEIDFLTLHKTQEMETKLAPYHSRLYQISSLKHPIRQYRETKRILKEGKCRLSQFLGSHQLRGSMGSQGSEDPEGDSA